MLRRHFPILIASVVALLHIALMVRAAMSHTGGDFSYPVDDAYIHLALARHIAFDGVYGVTKYAFSASSSSVVWPWLLAGALRIFGNHVVIPLLLNVAAAVGLIAVIGRGLEREAPSLSATTRTVVLLAVVLLVPIATLAMIGMEHMLQAALTVAFVLEASRVVSPDAGESERQSTVPLLVLACALVATRYEGAFPVGIAVVLLAMRRRFGLAAALALAGAAPVVLFGLYSMAHGSLFLPNSIALKRQHLKLTELSDLSDVLGGNVLSAMSLQSYLMPLGFGTLALFVRELWRGGMWTRNATRLLLAFGTTVAHVELASLGWFYRYEAYLVALDITVIAMALAPQGSAFSLRAAWRRSRLGFVGAGVAAVLGSAPLGGRALAAQGTTPTACRNIYEQQVQTARFLARYFPNDLVALNDIGAVAYYREGPQIDLEGLASLPIARAKSFQLDKPLDAEQLMLLTKDAPVAIIYDEWFPNLPTTWVRLGRLKITANKVCAFSAVAIYATSGESVPRVLSALRDFGPSLPAEVRKEGLWVETPPQDRTEWRADTGDALVLEVPGAPELSTVVWVDPDGSIWLPKVGELRVRGMSLTELNEATRARVRSLEMPWPGGTDAHLTLFEERRCHVVVAGNVFRTLDEPVECGSPVGRALRRAGVRRADTIDPYVWRADGGTLKRIAFDYDPTNDTTTPALALRGGDVVIVN